MTLSFDGGTSVEGLLRGFLVNCNPQVFYELQEILGDFSRIHSLFSLVSIPHHLLVRLCIQASSLLAHELVDVFLVQQQLSLRVDPRVDPAVPRSCRLALQGVA